MKTIQLLEDEDLINPNDWCRPLIRSADYSNYSDAWMTSGTYDGNPLDHLKWIPVWLKLGQCWWGYKYQEYTSNKNMTPIEFIRGNIPNTHKLDLIQNNWHTKHPLWWETYLAEAEKINNLNFNTPRYKNKTVEWVRDNDYSYYEWYKDHVDSTLASKIRFLHKFENHHVYYHPEYRDHPII